MIQSLLYNVTPTDPLSFGATALVLAAVTILAELRSGQPGHARRSDHRAPRRLSPCHNLRSLACLPGVSNEMDLTIHFITAKDTKDTKGSHESR